MDVQRIQKKNEDPDYPILLQQGNPGKNGVDKQGKEQDEENIYKEDESAKLEKRKVFHEGIDFQPAETAQDCHVKDKKTPPDFIRHN